MDDIQLRLEKCFSGVFPKLAREEVPNASPDVVASWDSVASVTLFATIEEEFGLEIDVQDLTELTSFQQIHQYLLRRAASSTA